MIKVYAQNLLDGYSKPEAMAEYTQAVYQLKPDVAIFTEAYKEGKEDLVPRVVKQLQKQGYVIVSGRYEDEDGRKDRHGILLATRKAIVAAKHAPRLVKLAGRNVAECWLTDDHGKLIHFIGAHLNDRSEARRQAELDDLLKIVEPTKTPTIFAGDLNSLYKADATDKEFRKARRIHLLTRLKLMPVTDPTDKPAANTRGRKGSIYKRMHEAASGKTMQRLVDAGFKDADIDHRATFPASRPFAQIDHIMLSKHFTVHDFTVLPRGSSDHLGITATVKI